jgi:hypothetical protein
LPDLATGTELAIVERENLNALGIIGSKVVPDLDLQPEPSLKEGQGKQRGNQLDLLTAGHSG